MLFTLLKELQKRHHHRKIQKKIRKIEKKKRMSFNRDVGFRYLSSSPSSRDSDTNFRNKNKLYRSQSELGLNELTQKSDKLFVSDNFSDADGSFSHRTIPIDNRSRNASFLHSQRSSSLHEDESEDQHEETHHKRLKNKKKSKKHKRAIGLLSLKAISNIS